MEVTLGPAGTRTDISDAIYYVGTGQLAKNLWKVNPKVYPRQLLK